TPARAGTGGGGGAYGSKAALKTNVPASYWNPAITGGGDGGIMTSGDMEGRGEQSTVPASSFPVRSSSRREIYLPSSSKLPTFRAALPQTERAHMYDSTTSNPEAFPAPQSPFDMTEQEFLHNRAPDSAFARRRDAS